MPHTSGHITYLDDPGTFIPDTISKRAAFVLDSLCIMVLGRYYINPTIS